MGFCANDVGNLPQNPTRPGANGIRQDKCARVMVLCKRFLDVAKADVKHGRPKEAEVRGQKPCQSGEEPEESAKEAGP